MRLSRIAGIAVATLFTVTPSAFAQTQTKSSDTAAIQTFTGCLMTEPAYRKAHNLGDGALGGVGLGDEFVLVDVKVSPAKVVPAMPPRSAAAAAASSGSASTCADQGLAYRVTGTAEERIKGLVGHQLEIQGRFKHSDDAAAGGTRPGEKLPAEVEIVSFREAPSPVPSPAVVSEPASPPPPPPASTVEPTRTTEPARTTSTPVAPAEPRTMPRTAGSSALLALIGVLAFASAAAVVLLRRRAA